MFFGPLEQPCKVSSQMANYQARLLNLDLLNFGSGAESADALQPRATPWVSESIGAPCKGAGILLPRRAEEVPRTRSRGVAPGWHAPRRWRNIVAAFSSGGNPYEAICEAPANWPSRG